VPDLIAKLAARFGTPRDLQRYLRTFPYNRESDGETCRSAAGALRAKAAHCLEAAFIAAAALERRGFPPLVMSLESVDNLDHVVFVFQDRGRWGSIARSRCPGLHGREPVFKRLRDLAWSYVDPFVDKTGRVTGYGLAHLDESGADWRASKTNVWKAERFLIDLKHQPIRVSDARHKKSFDRYLKRGEPLSGPHWW